MASTMMRFWNSNIMEPILHTSIGKAAFSQTQAAVAGAKPLLRKATDFVAGKATTMYRAYVKPVAAYLFESSTKFVGTETDGHSGSGRAPAASRLNRLLPKRLLPTKEHFHMTRAWIIQMVILVSIFLIALAQTSFWKVINPMFQKYAPRKLSDTVARVSINAVEYTKPVMQAVMVPLNKLDVRLLGGAVMKFIDEIIKGVTDSMSNKHTVPVAPGAQ